MTNLTTVARAVSLTRVHQWGAEVAVLLHLAADPTPFGVVNESYAELGVRIGVGDGQASRAVGKLLARHCIVRDGGLGSAPSTYRVLDPREWGEVPWRLDRREAIISLDASNVLDFRAQDIASPRAWARGRRLLVRASRRAGEIEEDGVCPRVTARGQKRSGPRAWARGQIEPSLSTSRQIGVSRDDLEGGREVLQLSEAQKRLIRVFFDGAPELMVLRGNPLHRLMRVAVEANGSLDELVRIAGDVTQGGRWLDRVKQIEEAATHVTNRETQTERSWPPPRKIEDVMVELDASRPSDVGRQALVEAKKRIRSTRTEHRVDNMGTCSESGCDQTA